MNFFLLITKMGCQQNNLVNQEYDGDESESIIQL